MKKSRRRASVFFRMSAACLVIVCRFSLAAGEAPFQGCGPVLVALAAELEQHGKLKRAGSEVVSANRAHPAKAFEFDFSKLAFYEPDAIYVGMKSGRWGLHFFTIVRNQRLDGWAVGNALLEVSAGATPTVNGEPLTAQVRERWRMGEFTDEVLKGDVPPASYGLLFKIKVDAETLDRAQVAMQSVVDGECTRECLTPPIKVLRGAGIEIPGLDLTMNVNGLGQSLAEALLHQRLRWRDETPPVALLVSDHAALSRLSRYWTARDAAVREQWESAKLWDRTLGWQQLSPPATSAP